MEAGLELNDAIAERVMGWTRICTGYKGTTRLDAWQKQDGTITIDWHFNPSARIADAWLVVESVGGWFHLAHFTTPERWRAALSPFGEGAGEYFEAATAPLAICRAALSAVGSSQA